VRQRAGVFISRTAPCLKSRSNFQRVSAIAASLKAMSPHYMGKPIAESHASSVSLTNLQLLNYDECGGFLINLCGRGRHAASNRSRMYQDMSGIKLKLATVGVAGLVLFGSGCSEPAGRATDTAVQASTTPASTPTTTTTVATPPAPLTTTALPASWVMPNLVGQNLQAAQDAIQALTDHAIFFTSSTDATGQGRAQVLDANWKVCSQNIKPGETITASTKIEFAVVKLDEHCP